MGEQQQIGECNVRSFNVNIVELDVFYFIGILSMAIPIDQLIFIKHSNMSAM